MEKNQLTVPGTSLQYDHCVPVHINCPYPILLIHGMFGTSAQFHLSMEYALRHGYEVYALNFIGHAPGQRVINTCIEDYVQNCIAMLNHIARPTILVGHSTGGLVAQIVAEKLSSGDDEPNGPLVRAAVFMASNMPGKILFKKEMLCWHFLKSMATNKPLSPRQKELDSLFLNSTPKRDNYRGCFTGESAMVLLQVALGLASVNQNLVVCPTLVLSFARDRVTPPSLQNELADKYGSEYDRFEGDHMTFMWSVEPMEKIIKWIRSKRWFYSGLIYGQSELGRRNLLHRLHPQPC